MVLVRASKERLIFWCFGVALCPFAERMKYNGRCLLCTCVHCGDGYRLFNGRGNHYETVSRRWIVEVEIRNHGKYVCVLVSMGLLSFSLRGMLRIRGLKATRRVDGCVIS